MTARDLLAQILLRDAIDSLTRAISWTVVVYHVESTHMRTLYGQFEQPAAALEWATNFQTGLNIDGEDGFRCDVEAVLPAA